MAHFRSSGGMPSGAAARPLSSFEIARDTSSRVGMSVEISGFGVVAAAFVSSAEDGAPGGWFRAVSKCSRQHESVSSRESHADPSALLMTAVLGRLLGQPKI